MSNSRSFLTYCPPGSEGSPEKNYILLHPTCSRWIAVNGTSLEIADLLDKGQSIEETACQLTARYGVPLDSATEDVLYVAGELKKQHFFCGNSRDFSARSPTLGSLFLHITTRCNLSCNHCYIACPTNDDLPVSLVLRLIEEALEHQCVSATLSGGEPLLHPEIRTIMDYASRRIKLQLLTNGTLITREWADFLAQTISAIQISVDGSTHEIHDAIRGNGAFDRAIRAIECLQNAGLAERITLSATIMRQNLDDLPGIIALAERLGIPSVRFLPLRKSGRAHAQWGLIGSELKVEHSERFYQFVFGLQQSRRYAANISCGLSGFMLKLPDGESGDECWCPVGKKLVVDVDGNIYPCVLLMEDEFRLGNAFNQNLGEVLHSDRMLKLCSTLLERRTKILRCAECLWRNLCQAGCMGQALDHCGTIWDTDHFCDFRNKAYQNAFDRILQGSLSI
jgi:mycofactocin biosynthetic radical S-adenosylmethionine protein MftC